MNQNKAVFETMPVPKALATLAVPTIISQLITMVYNLADTFFIGRTNDPYKVAAASLAYVLFFIMNALSNLFGIGGGSLISRLLGRGKNEDAKAVCAFSFWGTVAVTMLYSLGCLVFMEPLLRAIGASDNTLQFASAYTLWVVVVGGLPSTLSMAMAHLLRSEGYAKQASFGLGMGGVLNMLLDPLFMFVIMKPGNEVTGAAVATMLSNVVAFCYYLVIFARLRGKTVLTLAPNLMGSGARYAAEIFSVGLPSALGSALSSASNMTVNSLVSGYGDVAVAAMGIVKKIDMLPMNVGMGLCQGMMPLVAYNYSAKNYDRMRSAANYARVWGMGFAGLCIVVYEVLAGGIVSLFIKDAATLSMGTDFLRIACIATPVMICNFQMSYTFQAMGKGKPALLLSSCRQGLINIPLLFIMNHAFGVYGVIWTQLLADGLTLVLSLFLYRRLNRDLRLG
ncbi:MAG: MATE family efflux transporter [Oscillospiraceae bacterium]|nr:MATE family efflux transporter [Oscillospiraceae bacterium]